MPYTMEQFQKDYIKAHIRVLDPEEILSKFKAEERLKGLGQRRLSFIWRKLRRGRSLMPKAGLGT